MKIGKRKQHPIVYQFPSQSTLLNCILVRLLHPTSNSTKNVSQKNVLPISLSLPIFTSLSLHIEKYTLWLSPAKARSNAQISQSRQKFVHISYMIRTCQTKPFKHVFAGNPNDVFSLFVSGVNIPTFGCLPGPFADLFLDSNPMYIYLLLKSPSADYYVVSRDTLR